MKITSQLIQSGKLRQLNILCDLSKVADLVELCFHQNMDSEGKSYLRQMRHASKKSQFLSWTSNSVPLKGYVWAEKNKIIGNISIIPFQKTGKKIFLLANVAVHPDHRRKGIAKALTEKGLEYARQHGAKSIWVHVKDDNPTAIKLYENLGFQERTSRTTWVANAKIHPSQAKTHVKITSPSACFWEREYHWLTQNYPEEIRWYRMPNWKNFKPGMKYFFYKFFVESDNYQWIIQKDGKLEAALIATRIYASRSYIWLATAQKTDSLSLTHLLLHARLHLSAKKRKLYLNYPANQSTTALQNAGFTPLRTLIWMKADGAV